MTYTREQLISALSNEYAYLCAESPDDDDMTRAEYLDFLHDLSQMLSLSPSQPLTTSQSISLSILDCYTEAIASL